MEIYTQSFCDVDDDVDPCAAYVRSYITTVDARNEWEKLTLAEQLDRIATTPKKRMRTNAPRFTAVELGGKRRGVTYCDAISTGAARARNERLLCVERTAKAALAALQREPPLDEQPKKRMRTNAPRITTVKLGGKGRGAYGVTYCDAITTDEARAGNERLFCVEGTAKRALAALQREPPLDHHAPAPAPAPAALPPKKAMRGVAVASWRVR